MRDVPNYIEDKEASDILAAQIRAWWHRRGIYPRVWSEKQPYDVIDGKQRFIWVVRSSLQLRVPKDIYAT